MDYHYYTPAAYKLIRIHTMLFIIIGLIALTGIGFILKHFLPPHTLYFNIAFAVLIALAIIGIAYALTDYCLAAPRYRYLITEDKVECISGYFFVTRKILPLKRLQKVETVSGPIAQHFQLTTITLTSAGGTIDINHIPTYIAEPLAERLKNRLNEILDEDESEQVNSHV